MEKPIKPSLSYVWTMMWNLYPSPILIHVFIALGLSLSSSVLISQVQDNFDDGDFLSNPTWIGSSENFVVNTAGALQLNDEAPLLTQSVLSTATNLVNLNDVEWRMNVSQGFAGSDNNHSRIYLTSSLPNPSYPTAAATGGTQGYFIRLGEGGSDDRIKLYIDNGSTTTLLATGTTVIASAFDLALRVTRSAAGLWSIYADATGGENYNFEASVSESTLTTANYFAVVCTYTSSNSDNFSFDNMYVGDILVDSTPPSLSAIEATSANTLMVTMSEPVLESSISTAQFSITGSIEPILATLDLDNPALILLTFANDFTPNTTITLTISGIEDGSGNVLLTANGDFIWSIATPAAYRDVVFNEVLADPTPVIGLPEVEYLELYNRTSQDINLEGWVLTNSTTDKILSPYLLPANEYVVLCNSTSVGSFSNALGIVAFTALTNGTDSLSLKDSEGNLIDVLVYTSAWYATSTKADGGWSLEQINPDYPCGNNAGNWAESTAPVGGTPGTQNSVFTTAQDNSPPNIVSIAAINSSTILIAFSEVVDTTNWTMINVPMTPFNQIMSTAWSANGLVLTCNTQSILDDQTEYTFGLSPIADCYGNTLENNIVSFLIGSPAIQGDLRINEIYADPDITSSLPNDEWIELSNTTDNFIQINNLVLNGQLLLGEPIAPHGYIVLTDDSSMVSFQNFNERVSYLTSFPSLTNSGSNLSLQNTDGELIDQVTYDITWYHDATKDDGGWSLELINPTLPCSGANNWTASVAENQGTPGQINSVNDNTVDTQAPTIVSVTPIDESHISINFSEIMNPDSWTGAGFDVNPFNGVSEGFWNAFNTSLVCVTTAPLNPSSNYDFILFGFTDCSGNALASTPFNFILGSTPLADQLIITEIMCDPTPSQGLPDAEYIEIINPTNLQLNLFGLSINGAIVSESYLLGPGARVMVTDVENELAFLFYEIDKLFVDGFDELTNSGGSIEILDSQEMTVHEVRYSSDWYVDTDKSDGGWSLEMINPSDPCSYADNWRASVSGSGGTPGTTNSVDDNTPDTAGPELEQVYTLNDSTLILDFNEPLLVSSLFFSTMSINGGDPQLIEAEIGYPDITTAVISIEPMEMGVRYDFALQGILDCWENESGTVTGRFAKGENPLVGDLIVNEILYDPYENGNKFIEIYNTSAKTINLSHWQLNDLSGGDVGSPNIITDKGVLLFAGEYLVLTERISGVVDFYSRAQSNRIIAIDDLPDYTSDDMVILMLPDSTICDQVAYNADYHYPLLEDTKGVSIERIDPKRASTDKTNWHSASSSDEFATPGYLNSQAFSATITTSTFLVEPESFSPDNDGYEDQTQFTYQMESEGFTGSIKIYDADGRLIRDVSKNELLGRTGTVSWDGLNNDRQKAPIGIYIVYFEAFNTSGQVQKHKTTCVLAHPLN